MARSSALPTKAAVKDKKAAVDYNEGLVENAEDTLARIRKELETRQNDLEKIKNLEVKIEKENGSMNDKIEKMEDEMKNKFPNVGKLKSQIETDKIDTQMMKEIL
jgi:predicted  nucleic acid-binding Zn-ribbon protein